MTDIWQGIRESASQILASGEEPRPVAFFLGEDGGLTTALLMAPKPTWPKIIQEMASQQKCPEVGFVTSVWAAKLDKEEGERYLDDPDSPPPSQHPARRSMAMFVLLRRDGSEEVWMAPYETVGDDEDDLTVVNPGEWHQLPPETEDILFAGVRW